MHFSPMVKHAVLVCLWAGLLWGIHAGAEPVFIELREEAYANGDSVRLGDISDLSNNTIPRLEDMEISSVPSPGDTKRIDSALIEARLRNAGLERDDFELGGARHVRITAMHLEISSRMIRDDLHNFIENSMPWDKEEATIDVDAPSRDYAVRNGDIQIVWTVSPQYDYVGRGSFRGEILVDGEHEQTVVVRAEVESFAPVVVANTDISRGDTIRRGDIGVQRHPRTSLGGDFFEDPGAVVGQAARSTLRRGNVITSRQVQARQVVRRNRIVQVETRVGNLVVRGMGRAQEHGRVGDRITLENPDSGDEFSGRVQEDGTVLVE